MVIDTNILIACLNAESSAATVLSEWKQQGRALLISSVSVAETLAIASITAGEIEKIKAFLREFISISFDDAIAEMAGFLRRKYHLEIPDAAIAATAFSRNVPLVSRDQQFRRVSEITLIEL